MEKKLVEMPQGSKIIIKNLFLEKAMIKKLCSLGLYKLQSFSIERKCASGMVLASNWGKIAIDISLASNIAAQLL